MRIKLLLLFTVFPIYCFSQVEKSQILNGEVCFDSMKLESVTIKNSSDASFSFSDNLGRFSIFAKIGDTLFFSSVGFESKEVILIKENFSELPFKVSLKNKINVLNEVKINNNINSVSLGIVSKDQKKYTVAERRLKTAGDFKPIHLLAILGGSMEVDPILNAINGKTKRIKKEIAFEKKVALLEKILNDYDELFFTDTLKIPIDYVKAFLYYSIEDEKLVASINDENKIMQSFLMNQLAQDFLQLLKEE